MSVRYMCGAAGLAALAVAAGCGDGATAPAPTRPATTSPVSTTAVVVPAGPKVQRPEGFPEAAEARLMTLVDDPRREWCTRESAENRHPGSRAGVFCDLRVTDRVRLYLDAFPTTAGADRIYARYRDGRRVPAGAPCAAPRDDRRPGEGTWRRGRVMCFTYDGDFWLVFTDTRARSLGFVVAADAEPVRAFFRAVRAGA